MYDINFSNGNGDSLIWYIMYIMEECGYTKDDIKKYLDKVVSKNYNTIVNVSKEYVAKCN